MTGRGAVPGDKQGARGVDQAPEPSVSGSTVLVADSQALFAEALGRLLSRGGGFTPVEPHPCTGVAAAQAAVILRPHLALLDLWLEGIAAPEVTRSLKAKSPTTRVVILGWFHTPEHVRSSLAAGAAGFFSKSLSSGQFLAGLRRVATGERVVADSQTGLDQDAPATSASLAGPPNGDGDSALTPRELEVLRLLGAGLPTEDVASQLGVARETARRHITALLDKTGAHSQLEAVALARDRGALP